jgi:Fur family ferric uptake transcriptional regulator
MAMPSEPRDQWAAVPDRFRGRGLRWTPQRRAVVDVLAETDGHITGAELVERCRARDPRTIPSTVYRTLDVLEELGLVRHGHGADGREEYHVGPEAEHGHMYCAACGGSWEIPGPAADRIRAALAAADGFEVDVSHVTVVGRCRTCGRAASA